MASTLKKLWNKYIWAFENGDPRMDSWLLVHLPLPVILLSVFYLLVVASPCFMSGWECLRFAGSLAAYSPGLVAFSGYIFYEATLCTADRMIIPDTYAPKGTADPMKASQQQGQDDLEILMLIKITWLQATAPLESPSVNTLSSFSPFPCAHRHLPANRSSSYYERSQSTSPFCMSAMFFTQWAGVRYVSHGQGSVATVALSSYSHFTECSFPDGFNMVVLLCSLSVISLFLNCHHQTYLRGKREKLTSGAGPKD
ncbi:uncharacterized protein LOC109276187 isoform X2 [Panthera pardus]|nr:uncharacterized protein LOC109276187 isoform X2 [Panthera pardus]